MTRPTARNDVRDHAAAPWVGELPGPFSEIRLTSLSATRGANYWSSRPVTRLDLMVGAYEDLSSADAPGFTERLVEALPGLVEHRCSIGERGGFITRLYRGTYTPHIVEHVALELQGMIGHDVGYGRTRGGDVDGEYTVVFEHRHEAVGLRAAALALDVVQQTFAGTLVGVDHATAELATLAAGPDVPALEANVLCGITGGSGRGELRAELARRECCGDGLIVDVSPGFILQAGLPYANSEMAVVLDNELTDVPERYRDAERATRLVSVVADAVPRGGIVIAPAKAWPVQDYARDQGCIVAVFSSGDDVTAKDRKVSRSAAWVVGDEIVIEHRGRRSAVEERLDTLPPGVQASAALAEHALRELRESHESGARRG